MHGLVGHLAASHSNHSVANASHKAMSSHKTTVSSHKAAMSTNEGTRSRYKTVSSNEASVSSNETKVGHRGGSGSSHKGDNRCKGLEMISRIRFEGKRRMCSYLHIAVRVKTD